MAQDNQNYFADYTREVKSTSTRQSRKFKDIDLNFTRHPVTNDIGTIEDVIAIKRSVRNLIQTNYYERPFHPELGCGIRQLLFENYTPMTSIFLKRKIEEVLQNYEPRVNLTSILINNDNFSDLKVFSGNEIDNNKIVVSIHFYIVGVAGPQSTTVELQRLR